MQVQKRNLETAFLTCVHVRHRTVAVETWQHVACVELQNDLQAMLL